LTLLLQKLWNLFKGVVALPILYPNFLMLDICECIVKHSSDDPAAKRQRISIHGVSQTFPDQHKIIHDALRRSFSQTSGIDKAIGLFAIFSRK
jgi:hypothetical protein